jgi:hypothetical protein
VRSPHHNEHDESIRQTWPHLTVADSDEDRHRRDELIAATIEVWQPHSERKLTGEDARQIIENIVGFFDLLIAWSAEEEGVEDDASPRAA